MQRIQIAKVWASGDFMYAAVSSINVTPAPNTHRLLVNGRELPVARVHVHYDYPPFCVDAKPEYSIAHWMNRDEWFPEPIRGYNG